MTAAEPRAALRAQAHDATRAAVRGQPRRWRRCAAVVLALLLIAQPAAGKVLVLTFRGPNATKVRAAVTSALAAAGQDAAEGDTSFEDAAVLIGCDPTSDACASEVVSTLAVDEIVFGTTSKNGELTLSRAAANRPRRTTRTRLEPGQALEAAVTPAVHELYGDDGASDAPAPAPAPTAPAPVAGEPVSAPAPAAADADSAPLAMSAAAEPAGRPRRWAMISWSAAGVSTAAGLLLWLRASSLQDDIDQAPDGTPAQVAELMDLESRADTAATWGNVMVVVGAGLAGLGTYFWIKDRRARAVATALQPMVMDRGVGLVLTLGARP